MKKLLILLLLGCSSSLFSQNQNVVLRDTVMFPNQTLANIWGFKKGGKEYALVGASKGLIIVDVTDPTNCFRVGNQLTDGINSLWREVRTFGNYAFITSEGLTSSSTGGLGIVDLSGLPTTPPTTVNKYFGDGWMNNRIHRTHALQVDTVRSRLYLFGGRTGTSNWVSNGGAVRLNISNPVSPVFVDSFYMSNFNECYVHDGYAHKDTLYAGNIYAGKFRILKFDTNLPADTIPTEIGTFSTPLQFTHNTWTSANRKYLFTTDEKQNSYLASYDLTTPANPVEIDRIRTGTSGAIIHNTHVKGNFAHSSYYEDGVTITDISRPGNLIQVGRYDTYQSPYSVGSSHFDGAWGVYPFLLSGNILVTNITNKRPYNAAVDTGVLYILTPTYYNACFLEGNVKDASTNANLSGVTVAIQYSDPLNSGTSGLDGNYATGQPTSGIYNVIYSKSGYVSQTLPVTLANGQVTAPATVYLAPIGFPLELLKFSAKAAGKTNLLEWTTAYENNTDRHEIEVRHLEDAPWSKLGEVDATGISTEELRYAFTDIFPEQHSYYRLKTVDLDGQKNYSPIVEVSRPGAALSLGNIYPVPTSGILQLNVSSDLQLEVELLIGNLSGAILLRQTLRLAPGENKETLELPTSWADGQYWVRISNGNLESRGTFILQR